MAQDKKIKLPTSVGGSLAPRFGFFLLCVVLLAGYIMSRIQDAELGEVAPYFLFAIFLQTIPFIVRPTPDPFEPAGLTSVLNLLALVPGFTTYVVQQNISLTLLPQVTGRSRVELVQTVMIAYMVGTISYLIGYYSGYGKRLARIFPDVAGGVWLRSRILLVCLGCFAIFVPAYAYFQSRVGASLTDITQLSAGKRVWHDDATMSWLIRAVGIGFIPPLILVALNFPKFRWGRGIATFGLLFVVGFLSTRLGGRGTAIFCTLNALIVVHYLGRRIPISVLAGLGFAMIVVTNVLGAYRNDPNQTTASAPNPAANFNATQQLVDHDDDRVRIAAMAVLFYYFPDRKDYLMGESWGPALTVFIPRWLWPEKNQMFLWRDSNIVPMLTGAPVPVPYLGLLYANFSWIGIVFGMLFWGSFQRGMYEWLLKDSKDKSVVLLYSFFVVYFTPTMLQLSATIGYALPAYVALKFMHKRLKLRSKALPGLPAKAPSAAATPLLPAGSPPAAE